MYRVITPETDEQLERYYYFAGGFCENPFNGHWALNKTNTIKWVITEWS